MPNILSVATTAANSTSFVLDGTTETTLKLIGATGSFLPQERLIEIDYQGTDGGWVALGWLTTAEPVKVLKMNGTIRVQRPVLSSPVGCDRD